MTTLREAAQAALKALELSTPTTDWTHIKNSLRAALAAEPAQPVVFVRGWKAGSLDVFCAKLGQTFTPDQPLYPAPQPSADVPLMTDDDLWRVYSNGEDGTGTLSQLRAVEAEVRRRMGVSA